MPHYQMTRISVQPIPAGDASGGDGHNINIDVASMNIYLRQQEDERLVSLERETGGTWTSPPNISMALNRAQFEIIASCRAYGELGFIIVAEDQLPSDQDEHPTKVIKQRFSPATHSLGSTALWLALTLSFVGDDYYDVKDRHLSPVLHEIDKAIELEQKAICCSEGDIQARYANLGVLFSRRFTHTKDISDLRQAIFSIETSIDMAMEESDNLSDADRGDIAERLSKLGDFHNQCFEATGDALDLDEVIDALRKAVDITPNMDADKRPSRLNNLSNALQTRFDISQDTDDIEEAIANLRAAVESTPECHGNLPTLFSNLGSALLRRFEALNDSHDLDEAIANQQRAVDLSESGHPERRYWLSKVALAHQRRFERAHDLKDINESINFKNLAVKTVEQVEGQRRHSNDLSAALQSAAYGCYLKFKTTETLSDLEEAIAFQQRSLDLTPPGSPKTLARLKNLSVYCDRRFMVSREKEHLINALTVQQDLIDQIKLSDNHSSLPEHYETLGRWLQHRFQYSQDVADLEHGVLSQRSAVQLAPASPQYLSSLARSLRLQFDRSQDPTHIEEAVALARKASSLTPLGEGKARAERLHELSQCLNSKNTAFAELDSTEEAVSVSQLAVDLTDKSEKDDHGRLIIPSRLLTLGIALQHRHKRTRQVSDLKEAIAAHEEAVSLVPESDRDLTFMLNGLCAALQRQYDARRDTVVIERVIHIRRRMVRIEEEKEHRSQDLASWVEGLANALHQKYQRSGVASDINEAIENHGRAIALTSPIDSQLPSRLTNFAYALKSRADSTRSLEDLDKALEHLEKARKLTPDSHLSSRSAQYLALGVVHQARFRYGSDPLDILFSIEYLKESIDLLSPAPGKSLSSAALRQHGGLSTRLNNLGISFRLRFERHGDLSDIQEAISAQQKVVRMTPHDHAEYPAHLTNLGNSFLSRYRRTEDKTDLEEAIRFQDEAVRCTPVDDPQHPLRLLNMSLALRARAEHTTQLSDFEEAITLLQTARTLESVEADPALQADIIDALGNVFHAKYKATNCLDDLQQAISLRRQAISLLSNDSPLLIQPLNNLGTSLHYLYARTGDIQHLDESITTLQRVVGSLSPDSPKADLRFNTLINLANAQTTHYYRSNDISYGRQAASNMRTVVIHPGISPRSRINIARKLARLTRRFDKGACLYAYKVCIKLIAVVGGLEQTIESRHTALASISNITLEAAAAAVELQVPQLAMEWLEQGRCLVWTQLNSLRTPMESIRSVDPSLVDRLTRLSPLLEKMGSRKTNLESVPGLDSTEQSILLQEEVVSHVNLAQEWEEALADVRAIDGFEDFLKPPSVEEWFDLIPPSAAVVVINVHQTRCDALILQSGATWPVHVELPDVSYAMVEDWRADLHRSLVVEGVRSRGYDAGVEDADEAEGRAIHPMRRVKGTSSMLEFVLKQLWIRVVNPIVEKLTLKASKDQTPKERLWWCPTGSLSFLPLHAAGIYSGPNPVSICDYAVSSYTPTLSSLLERLKLASRVRTPSIPVTAGRGESTICTRGMLLICEHNAPGLSPIPGAKAEVQAIGSQLTMKGLAASTYGGSTNTVATVDAGLSNMSKFTCVHLACHAVQDVEQPLRSGFHLQDGRLELSKIIQANMAHADLAFLSACQTSAGDEKLSEEAVHLAAGMLAAGYRGVVGTMWSIRDRYASEIAESFYDHLLVRSAEVGAPDIDGRYAAESLHHAITHGIRRKIGDAQKSLLVWVPYVHFGL